MEGIENLPGEEWRDIPGYEGLYKVSNMCRILNSKRSKIMALFQSKSDCPLCKLSNPTSKIRTTINVRKLAYELFTGKLLGKNEFIALKDNTIGDKLSNFEILKLSENCNTSPDYNIGDILLNKYIITAIHDRNKKRGPRMVTLTCHVCGKTLENIRPRRTGNSFNCDCRYVAGDTLVIKHNALLYDRYKILNITKLHGKIFVDLQCTVCSMIFHKHKLQPNQTGFLRCSCFQGSMFVDGSSKHALYPRWLHIKDRCYNPKNKNYSSYGGKGIFMCTYWLNSFYNFLEFFPELDYEHIKGVHLDRIDPRFEYAPYNCQLLTGVENARKARYDEQRTKRQLLFDEFRFRRRRRNWVKKMINLGYRLEDLI